MARAKTLKQYLVAMILVAIVPIIIAAGYAAHRAGVAFRQGSIDRLADTVVTLSGVVERDISTNFGVALLLASMDRDKLTKEDQLLALMQGGGSGYKIVDETFEGSAFEVPKSGSSPSGIPYETLREAAILGRPTVSNLFFHGSDTTANIAVMVLKSRTPGKLHFTGLIAPPSRIVRTLQKNGEASSILVAVTDGQGRLLARSRNADKFIGKPVPNWATLKATGKTNGSFIATTAEGGKVIFSFRYLPQTPGWVIVLGEPLKTFETKWRLPLVQLALGCLLALLTGIVAAAILSRKILVPIRALTRHIDEISAGRSSSLAGLPSTIDEFDKLRTGMANYETALTQRARIEREVTQHLAKSERRYRAVAEAGAMVFWTGGLDGKLLSATGWEDLTGQPERRALGSGWMKFVHPGDLKLRRKLSNRASFDGRFQDAEFRIRTAGGNWRWVRTRATLIEEDGTELEWVGVLEDVDARRRAQDELAYMALHDELTGLGNRNMLSDRLERMIAGPGKTTVICLDLDRFKEVNDTLGHSHGDELLKQVATRIRNCTAPDDLVVRLGGDEFAIARAGDASMHDISTLAGRLITQLSEPYHLGAASIVVGASAGIADAEGASAEELLRQADIALYAAKAAGRRQFRFFEPGMYAKLQRRGQIEAELRKAIELDQLQVYYQPLVNPVTCLPTGFEALLRWNHPERGLLLPGRFITIAEETGLIDEIGKQVLDAACREAAGWPDQLKVSVNISPVQLADKRLAEIVLSALKSSGLEASRLELEITENALVENIEQGMATLLRLKALGCGVVMDDFGSGGSSLEFLKAFPFSRVKIDKAFVQNLECGAENRAIVKAVISICSSLGIKSTGEGVETPEQLAILLSENCSEVQGYLFGRPGPAHDVDATIRRLLKEAPLRIASAGMPALRSA